MVETVSFTPGFSSLLDERHQLKPFQRFSHLSQWKPLKRFLNNVSAYTGLKPGVNEKDF